MSEVATTASRGKALQLRWTDHWKRSSNQLQRLHLALSVARPRIEARGSQEGASSGALELIEQAEKALSFRNPDVGWARLHAALELECLEYTDSEVETTAAILQNELGGGALSGWEAAAVREILGRLRLSNTPEPSNTNQLEPASRLDRNRMYLRQALKVRNGYFGSAYYVERIIAQRRLILVCVGMALLIVAFVVGRWADGGDDTWDYRIAIGSAIAGMIGAVTSASQRLVAHPSTAAPTDLGSFTAVIVRLFIGAVAALSVHVAVLSGFVRFPGHETATLILASFGVGFAERLVVYHPPQAAPQLPVHPTATLPRRT